MRYKRTIMVTRKGLEPVEFEPALGPFTREELGRPATDAGAHAIGLRVAALWGAEDKPVLGGVTSTDPEHDTDGRKNDDGHVLGRGYGWHRPGDDTPIVRVDDEVGLDLQVEVTITDPMGTVVGHAVLGGPA